METAHKIKVMIIDDHDSVRQSLSMMLECFDDFEVVASTDDARSAIAQCAVNQPDVVLMDLMMPKMDGITATRLLRSKFPDVEVIALTSSVEEVTIKDALEAGVIGYILKSGLIEDLANAIRDAYVGKHSLVAEAVSVLMDDDHKPPRNDYFLSKQEYDILALMVKGFSNQQIADQMMDSPTAVDGYMGSILTKLDTPSRAKAIAFAVSQQLLENTQF